jgi:hypothetical protein
MGQPVEAVSPKNGKLNHRNTQDPALNPSINFADLRLSSAFSIIVMGRQVYNYTLQISGMPFSETGHFIPKPGKDAET